MYKVKEKWRSIRHYVGKLLLSMATSYAYHLNPQPYPQRLNHIRATKSIIQVDILFSVSFNTGTTWIIAVRKVITVSSLMTGIASQTWWFLLCPHFRMYHNLISHCVPCYRYVVIISRDVVPMVLTVGTIMSSHPIMTPHPWSKTFCYSPCVNILQIWKSLDYGFVHDIVPSQNLSNIQCCMYSLYFWWFPLEVTCRLQFLCPALRNRKN